METNTKGNKPRQIVEIDLLEFFDYIWHKKMLLIIACALLAASLSGFLSVYVIKPLYRADFTVFINNRAVENESQLVSSADTVAAQSLTYTYSSLITNRSVLRPAADAAGMESYSYDILKGMVSADIEEKTQLINIHVTAGSPDQCLNLAGQIADIAPSFVEGIVDGTSMKVVSAPVTTSRPVYPNTKRNIVLGALAGFAVPILILLVLFALDTKVKDIRKLENMYGIPVIGTIPHIGGGHV